MRILLAVSQVLSGESDVLPVAGRGHREHDSRRHRSPETAVMTPEVTLVPA